jgi:chromosome segregation ATPase
MPPSIRFGPEIETPELIKSIDISPKLIQEPLEELITIRLDALTLLREACEQRDRELASREMEQGDHKHAHITELIDELQRQSNELQAAISFQEEHLAVHGETLGVPEYKTERPEIVASQLKERLNTLREKLLDPQLTDSVRGALHTQAGTLVTHLDELADRGGATTY